MPTLAEVLQTLDAAEMVILKGAIVIGVLFFVAKQIKHHWKDLKT